MTGGRCANGHSSAPCRGARDRFAFSLAELLVVLGILSLLIAIIVPPLQLVRRRAIQTKCSAQLRQLGRALQACQSEYGFYPLWDDGGTSVRYTWIDVLAQLRLLGATGLENRSDRARPDGVEIGYCPADALPDPLNSARNTELTYPRTPNRPGIDYSYGISVPLSAGGWALQSGRASGEDRRPRRFVDYDRDTSGRVLAGDAYASGIYNLSGFAFSSGIWNQPTQFDNTVAWGRHVMPLARAPRANLLFQDGHVASIGYYDEQENPVNTATTFVWYPGEPLAVGPADQYQGNGYPCQPPPSFQGSPAGDVIPNELVPLWYTRTHRWTRITHK